ncbi:acetyl/propionyl/methylcrotonyl-CoA carboxylase subunit alpha [Hellea balneolensis]|uniref:acetyl/propionyl/methylcrotonyl-CoA carboxylase subunit alpha n=1 Tax=Hellea balneolensis TaxID=287478 RepID=UPI000479A9B9|nr:acetyl/propionyl/methylcrotonyl-CoA carboxylase subunit alpha [Hellea balneolensis]
MTKKIKKILIANRGEIACRVIKTARKMGIATVAVYSDADKNAVHVKMADEAVHIGPPPAAESYLVADKIIKACNATKADAVHPGYGFLSENPSFVRACEAANITFIGPKAESMESMGLKDAAKKLMDAANVPITPGYHGENQDPQLLRKEAKNIGYPVLIKAVAGGGGKGMRKVDKDADFEASLASCQREATSSFGDDRVLIEKYITSPRHIEVQVFGDSHGNVVHMFERDCSLQRRHQKVIEEAPAPGMTDKVRKAMTEAAIQSAKAVNYIGAGTVEFIVDGSGALKEDGFWFMEMNTRLQVEHPVTEMITGLDLVEWQIRVAQGEKLPPQNEITLRGHALEARLYAEDPANDFLPSVGKLHVLKFPEDHRIDTGVEEGGEVSIFYDPMISKIIVHEQDRNSAIATLENQCRDTQVYPVKTNARFLANCLAHPVFIAGDVSTNFIKDQSDVLFYKDALSHDLPSLSSALAPTTNGTGFSECGAWRLNQPSRTTFNRIFDEEDIQLSLTPKPEKMKDYISCHPRPEGDVVIVDGLSYLIQSPMSGRFDSSGGNSIASPMPGSIIAVNAAAGDVVKAGDPLIVMEAMKMEMTLEAPRDGKIEMLNIKPNDLVADGDILLTLEEDT